MMLHQAASTDVLVIRLAVTGFFQRKKCSTLSVGDRRVSRILREFHTEDIIPILLHCGRPPKVAKAILDLIDIRVYRTGNGQFHGLSRKFKTNRSGEPSNEGKN
jgi:hypothetical protein